MWKHKFETLQHLIGRKVKGVVLRFLTSDHAKPHFTLDVTHDGGLSGGAHPATALHSRVRELVNPVTSQVT